MNNKKPIAIITTIFVIVGVSALLLTGPQSGTGLVWILDENDEYEYNVVILALNLEKATIELENPESLTTINNSVILITVLDLPQIPQVVTDSIFISEVIGKTNISIVYANGSTIQEEPLSFLNNLLTSTLLPVGNWSVIDDLFQDEDPTPPFCMNWYFSRLYESHMEFGYTLYGPDYAHGWKANISLETGVPFEAVYWSFNAIEEYSFRIVLTLDEET